ncbi:MAG: hypothetical protein RBS56_02545 [Candidatus Gracilibacteria bacterium]|jgi:hypothetical protein|nr:hypothetical protein [Candidatus Gracilibacteria bacterium]
MDRFDENREDSFFDREAYFQKIRLLEDSVDSNEYKSTKDIPKESGWNFGSFSVKEKLNRWLKIVGIKEANLSSGREVIRPFIIQEGDQYDIRSCNKIIGQIVLPVRFSVDRVLAGIRSFSPPGTYGKVAFGAPRFSLSNPEKSVFSQISDSLYEKPQRADFNRMTGQILSRIVQVDEEFLKKVDEKKEGVVWFDLEELDELMKDERFSDSISNALANRLLLMYS